MLNTIQKNACTIETDDIRFYLATYQDMRNSSKVTMDNIRRIMSDENLERLRDILGELESRVPYEDLVTTEFAKKAAQ